MKIPKEPVTQAEFEDLIRKYLEDKCEKDGSGFTCKKCGGKIEEGFVSHFLKKPNGWIDKFDGFGYEGFRVPFCLKCDPPNLGLHYTMKLVLIEEPLLAVGHSA